MKYCRHYVLFLCFAVASLWGVAQAADHPGRGGRDWQDVRQGESFDAEMQAQRRERMRNIRQDTQRQWLAPRDEEIPRRLGNGPTRQPDYDPRSFEPPPDQRNLRRLTPEAREQLRRDLREAAREMYRR